MEANQSNEATDLTLDEAANVLSDRWASDDAEPEAIEEAPEVEAETEEVEEAEEESDVQEPDDEDGTLRFESLEELTEALELSQDDFLTNFKGKVKIDGEESEISLSEALNGYQRQADYQRKTAEVAEQRRQFEESVKRQQIEHQQQSTQANAALQAAQNVLMAEFNGVNWQELEQVDPGQAALLNQKFQNRQAELNQYQSQVVQEQEQQKHYQKAQLSDYREQQKQALLTANPDWTMETDKAVASFLTESGVPQEVIGQMHHASGWLLAKELMDLRAEKKATKESVVTAKAKANKVKKMLKPGAKAKKQTANTERMNQLRNNLRGSGSVQDTAALLLERYR